MNKLLLISILFLAFYSCSPATTPESVQATNEVVLGFSTDSFYLALKSYNPNINSILPSQSIRLQDIFTE